MLTQFVPGFLLEIFDHLVIEKPEQNYEFCSTFASSLKLGVPQPVA